VARARPRRHRTIERTKAFDRDLKRLAKQGKDLDLLGVVIERLRMGETLPTENHDHALGGDLKGFRDCHIAPDWVLIYSLSDDVLFLARTGSHAEVF
jgi:mRNA interferase YafQ